MNKLAESTTTLSSRAKKMKPSAPDSKIRNAKPVMSVNGLFKSYHKKNLEVPVLKGVDLTIPTGDFTTIVGTSGSGKSTLLHLMGTLDAPDRGQIYYNDQRMTTCPLETKSDFATASLE